MAPAVISMCKWCTSPHCINSRRNSKDDQQPSASIQKDRERMSHRVSMAYHGMTCPPIGILTTYGPTVVELDMSHNKVSDLKFLSELPCLESLVLDHNRISSHVKIASCPTLETLWVNHNRIENLGLFISALTKSCPDLRILSMMNNVAAPSYFNGGTYQQFKDYRYFVISHMTKLEVLDDTKVTQEEIAEANRLYPVNLVKARRKARSRRNKTRDSSSTSTSGVSSMEVK